MTDGGEHPARPIGFNAVRACRHGQMVFNLNDRYIGRSLELYGEYSQGEVDLFRQIVRAGDVVVDAGANIGAHTVPLAQFVGPTGAVVAFEPQRVVFQTLCANLALNSLTNVVAQQSALGAEPGHIVVPNVDYGRIGNFGGLALGEHERGERVPVVRLDDFNLRHCRLMKIDVEGMELAVLNGAGATIERLHPLLYVENDRKDKAAALLRAIDGLGYAIYRHEPTLYSPANFLDNRENVFGAIVSRNLICVHKTQPMTVEGGEPVAIPPATG